MQGSIRSYIKSCEICERSKAPTLKPAGMLQPLEIPDRNFDFIWITNLLNLVNCEFHLDRQIVFSNYDRHKL